MYQAWTYAAFLEDFNTEVQRGHIGLQPCAYLHNRPRDGEIDHPHYGEHIERAPLFLNKERDKLQAFIRKNVRKGDSKGELYAIENGRIRPSVVGLKTMLRDDRENALELAYRIVKNTHRTLMTRGMKGCFFYCTDAPLAAYLRARLDVEVAAASDPLPSLPALAPSA